ncbi:MAG: hypothetical protein CL424_15595 [Acidimicrobiaceae bacterium]|nr:hypothetical protein [Acidimicrobiaceae bacterium]
MPSTTTRYREHGAFVDVTGTDVVDDVVLLVVSVFVLVVVVIIVVAGTDVAEVVGVVAAPSDSVGASSAHAATTSVAAINAPTPRRRR